ncbi:hypothetical protein [Streptomyces celluloflavus]|uniref:hypothetical protein n=1 Tax=Streptomyces celluloflavus TaxID=58344 RepID=UPI0036866C9F
MGTVTRQLGGTQIVVSRVSGLTFVLTPVRGIEGGIRLADAGGDARQPADEVRVPAAVRRQLGRSPGGSA